MWKQQLAAFDNFLQLASVSNHDLLACLTTLRSKGFNLLDYVHALNDLSENHVLAIQPTGLCCADKELGAIGVGTSVSHGQNTWASVGQLEVLILELISINRLATGSVVGCEITSLAHEIRDNSVKGGSFESKSLFSCTQSPEILCSLWDNVSP